MRIGMTDVNPAAMENCRLVAEDRAGQLDREG